MIDIVLLIGRLLFVALLYLFLFAIMKTGIGLVRGQRKKEKTWTVAVERGPKELRGVQIAVRSGRVGVLLPLFDLLRAHNASLVSMLTADSRLGPDMREVYLRISPMERSEENRLIEEVRARVPHAVLGARKRPRGIAPSFPDMAGRAGGFCEWACFLKRLVATCLKRPDCRLPVKVLSFSGFRHCAEAPTSNSQHVQGGRAWLKSLTKGRPLKSTKTVSCFVSTTGAPNGSNM